MKCTAWLVLVTLSVASWGFGRTAPASDELMRRAEVVKPALDELKWQQIPWISDLSEGLRLAGDEQRPIFLWATGDDPLERC